MFAIDITGMAEKKNFFWMAARKFYFEHCLLTEVRFGQNRNIFGPYLTDTAVCTCSQIPPIFANTSYSMILYRHSTFVFFLLYSLCPSLLLNKGQKLFVYRIKYGSPLLLLKF